MRYTLTYWDVTTTLYPPVHEKWKTLQTFHLCLTLNEGEKHIDFLNILAVPVPLKHWPTVLEFDMETPLEFPDAMGNPLSHLVTYIPDDKRVVLEGVIPPEETE